MRWYSQCTGFTALLLLMRECTGFVDGVSAKDGKPVTIDAYCSVTRLHTQRRRRQQYFIVRPLPDTLRLPVHSGTGLPILFYRTLQQQSIRRFQYGTNYQQAYGK